MPDNRLPLPIPAGLMHNGTRYQSKGRWYDGNLVRFYESTIRPVGGWVARVVTGAAIAGEVRGVTQWTPEVIGVAQRPILAIGTTTNLYVVVEDVVYDITPEGLGTDTGRVWSLEPFGSYLTATAHSPADFTKSQGMYVWQGDVATPALPVAGAPVTPTSVVATDERFLVQIGGVDPLGANYTNYPTVPSQRTVFWASQETLTDWTPTEENSAGSMPLATEGALLTGRRSRGQTLLWTSTDLFTMTFVGGEYVFRFEQKGTECGAISIRSPIMTDVGAFWMAPSGFFGFDGFVKPIACEVSDKVFSDFNRDLSYLVWGYSNATFGEVTWHYASAASSTLDRYVTFNYREGHWSFGALSRMAGVSKQPPGTVPVLLDAAGVIYDHETGNDRAGSVPFLESGPVELEAGDRVMRVQGLIPDEATLGQVDATLYSSMQPMGAETTYGPYTLTEETDLRLTARIVRLRLTEVAPADWRVGTLALEVVPGGRR